MKKAITSTILCAVAAAGLMSCNSDSGKDFTDYQQQILTNAADQVIIPAYAEFEDSTNTLKQGVTDLCSFIPGQRTDTGLESVRESWKAAMGAWARLQIIRFGPVLEENRQLSIQYWPDPNKKVAISANQIIADDAIITESYIRETPIQSQGLPILEYMLFSGLEGDPLADLNGEKSVRYCALLSAVSEFLHTQARTLHQNWVNNYRDEFTNPPVGNSFVDTEDAIETLINSMAELLQIIRDDKLKAVLGNTTTNPDAAESHRSQLSLDNIVQNLESLRLLYLCIDTFGFDDYLRVVADEAIVDVTVSDLFQQSIYAAAQIHSPLSLAVNDPTERALVENLAQHIDELANYVEHEFVAAMDASLGFNANDGD